LAGASIRKINERAKHALQDTNPSTNTAPVTPLTETTMTTDDKVFNEPENNPDANQPIAIAVTPVNENSGEGAGKHPPAAQPNSRPSSGRSLWRAFVFFFKLVLTLVILVGIAAGLYIGWPVVYNQYILPVKDNIARVAVLETGQKQAEAQLAALQTQQAVVRTGQTQQAETIAGLVTHVETIDTQIASHTASLAALEKMQTALQSDNQKNSSDLDRQIRLLKGMELLSRARLFLYESNFGLAKQDVQTARGVLAAVQASAPEPDSKNLIEVVNRLDLALSRLPEFPVPASDDLDIAWQVLLQDTPQIAAPTPTPTAAPSATATQDVTPTPVPANIPAATPTP
jgi:hypothetical protein